MRENRTYSLSGGRWPARERATSDPTNGWQTALGVYHPRAYLPLACLFAGEDRARVLYLPREGSRIPGFLARQSKQKRGHDRKGKRKLIH